MSDDQVVAKVDSSANELYAKLKAADPFFLLCGPCVVESLDHALMMSSELKKIADELNLPFVYKSSFDKANRTAVSSYRGPGLEEGLIILEDVKKKVGVPIITDVHEGSQCAKAATVADVLQIPAFLFRQTDLLVAAGETGKIINIKKGQWADAGAVKHAADKVRSTGNQNILVCDRGTSFGYHDLIVDPRNLVRMRDAKGLVVQDATHSVQQMGGLGSSSGGLRQFIPTIARTAAAVGVDGFFMEVHNDPEKAFSDGPNNWPLAKFKPLLQELILISKASKGRSTNYLD